MVQIPIYLDYWLEPRILNLLGTSETLTQVHGSKGNALQGRGAGPQVRDICMTQDNENTIFSYIHTVIDAP